MRSGGYTLQQSLTTEAANIVKAAIGLARRRGHAQVTPLHVASAMLANSAGLLRRACLQSHSHPLQFKALELCFNVALNRLPTSASSPILSPQTHLPSLSNALVAAFKRAQAHQRRGSIENQNNNNQQPILALKVEIEQLVISILDDPSVSRVMREAGFSSTQVKTNVEQSISLELSSHNKSKESSKPLILGAHTASSHVLMPTIRLSSDSNNKVVQHDDLLTVVEAMMSKNRKNIIVTGECLTTAESVIRGVINKFDKKDVPLEMRYVQFISVPLSTLRNVSREEFEEKLRELRSLVKGYIHRGVVLYLGDLNWVSEFWSKHVGEKRNSSSYYYSPVEYMIMELSRLLCESKENGKLWLMGIATFQTYTKCKIGRPCLETLWDIHPLTIPVGNLALGLNIDSYLHDQFRSKAPVEGFNSLFSSSGVERNLTCCSDCTTNFKREARSIASSNVDISTNSSASSLPSWLQEYKLENTKQTNLIDQEHEKLKELCNKWNSICKSVHKKPHFLETAFNISSSPSSSASISSTGQQSSKLHRNLLNWPVHFEQSQSPKEHQFFTYDLESEVCKPNIQTSSIPVITKPDLLSNPNSSPNSASSSEASGVLELPSGFKEHNSDNIERLCNALTKKVPWQKEIIPDIVSAILKCRSSANGRSQNGVENRGSGEESWLFFLGADCEGKEKIAREISKLVFGSMDNFITISLSNFSSSTRADSTEEAVSKKRARDEHGTSYFDRFVEALRDNPSRVFFLEDVDQIDYHSQKGFKKAIENGSVMLPDHGEITHLKDAIVIFSCESFNSASRTCSPPLPLSISNDKEKKDNELEENKASLALLDLNNVAIEDDDNGDQHDGGILDLVDKQIVFKIQVL